MDGVVKKSAAAAPLPPIDTSDRLAHLVKDAGKLLSRALQIRLDKLPENPGRDRMLAQQVDTLTREYEEALRRLPPSRRDAEPARQIRWMLEELRVSLFAQQLGTRYPVSEKRIRKAMAQL